MTRAEKSATAAQVDAIIVQGIDDVDYISALRAARDADIQSLVVTELPEFGRQALCRSTKLCAGRLMGEKLSA
jgi:ABC-type sugar transport system substrate-binding protein